MEQELAIKPGPWPPYDPMTIICKTMLKGDPECGNGARGRVEVEWDLECSVEHEVGGHVC